MKRGGMEHKNWRPTQVQNTHNLRNYVSYIVAVTMGDDLQSHSHHRISTTISTTTHPHA